MANITGYFVYILKKKNHFDKLCTNRLKKIFPRCTLSTRTACTVDNRVRVRIWNDFYIFNLCTSFCAVTFDIIRILFFYGNLSVIIDFNSTRQSYAENAC